MSIDRALRRILALADQLDPMAVRCRAGALALAAGDRMLAEDLYVSTTEGDFRSTWRGELERAALRDLLGDHDGATHDFAALESRLADDQHGDQTYDLVERLAYVGRLDEAWARTSKLNGYLPPNLVVEAARAGHTDIREALEDAGWWHVWAKRWYAGRVMAFVEEGDPDLARSAVHAEYDADGRLVAASPGFLDGEP
ncbi:MAG: hypothetical protein AAF602_29625, partial [Myxococcota bacterium]